MTDNQMIVVFQLLNKRIELLAKQVEPFIHEDSVRTGIYTNKKNQQEKHNYLRKYLHNESDYTFNKLEGEFLVIEEILSLKEDIIEYINILEGSDESKAS